MTIFWTFLNTPRGKERFRVELQPSVGDHIFEFNLAVHRHGDSTWVVLPNYVPGSEAHKLKISGQPGQDLLLLIKDQKGTEKRIRYSADVFWVDGGDIGTIQNIADYRKYFEESLGLSEEEMYCEALFDEYKKLEVATHAEAQDVKRGQPYNFYQINPQDLMRKKIIAKELLKQGRERFKGTPAEWFEIRKEAQ